MPHVTIRAPVKSTVKSPVKSASSGGTTRRVLPVHNESNRGRKPILRDELAVVASISTCPRERVLQHRLLPFTLVIAACWATGACSRSNDAAYKNQNGSAAGAAGNVKSAAETAIGGSGTRTGQGGLISDSAAGAGSDASGQAGLSEDGSGGSAGADAAPTSCAPPLPSELAGWAAVEGSGVSTTTGGGDKAPVTVTTLAELIASASGSEARVIYLKGNIKGTVAVGSNKTLVGLCGATLTGHLHLSASVNVIIRNLKMVGNNCSDSPSDCSKGADAVSVTNGAHHLWFDHCDISDGSDGNLDINAGSDFVTISYTKFSYSSTRSDPEAGDSGHRFSNLIGSGDTVAEDVGHLNVTFHHNWWAENVNQRMPRTRRGKIHVYNNLYTSEGNSYCTNAGFEAAVRVERNVYIGVNNPLSPDANSIGLESVENEFINTTGKTEGLRTSFTPPYPYSPEPTDTLSKKLQEQVGPK
jgi:pectate lyase